LQRLQSAFPVGIRSGGTDVELDFPVIECCIGLRTQITDIATELRIELPDRLVSNIYLARDNMHLTIFAAAGQFPLPIDLSHAFLGHA